MSRKWLDVPFEEKDEAKALGARWAPKEKRWYAPRTDMPELQRWAPRPEVPEVVPGEDRSFGEGLFPDPIPSSCWFTNVRSCVVPRDWERLRRMITKRAGQRCEICGNAEDRASRRWLEAHERWAYDIPSRTQSLRRLICLCTDCHTVTHFGLAQVRGVGDRALAHLRQVTGLSAADADELVQATYELWHWRSARTWTLDLSALTEAGITVQAPPEPDERQAAAERSLRQQNIW